ncbi:MAG TPA: acyltransferase [Frankiaceae bacterium]
MTTTAQVGNSPAPPATAGTLPPPPTRGHLDQVDLFRVLTFAAVVAVHATAFTNPSDSQAANALGFLLHFTREAFFVLTGFVLVYAQKDRSLQPAQFWRRRFRLIGIPYLTWSVLYWGYGLLMAPRPAGRAASDLFWAVAGGHAEYHLYFLMVSMQVYLVFPVLLWALRRTRHRPWLVLGSVTALQLVLVGWLHASAGGAVPTGWYARYAYVLLPSYLLWVVAGGLLALHLPVAQGFAHRHPRLLVGLGAAAVAASLGWYVRDLLLGQSSVDTAASAVLQPIMVLESAGVVILLAVVGMRWAQTRERHPRLRRALLWCSSASFGVYLIHPLILDVLLRNGLHGPAPTLVPQPWASAVAWLLTLAGSVAVVAVIRRTPVSLPLTGRSRPAREPAARD